eukprot:GHVT01059149.1.p1 GENE.GHVT01059149.1~~GHVT01059149.1.p1  ORF type:complete len:570 (+),score=156.69 GHVT01059149.1:690-2399(+)
MGSVSSSPSSSSSSWASSSGRASGVRGCIAVRFLQKLEEAKKKFDVPLGSSSSSPSPFDSCPYPAGVLLLAPMLSLEKVKEKNKLILPLAKFISSACPHLPTAEKKRNEMFPHVETLMESDPLSWIGRVRARLAAEMLAGVEAAQAMGGSLPSSVPLLAVHSPKDSMCEIGGSRRLLLDTLKGRKIYSLDQLHAYNCDRPKQPQAVGHDPADAPRMPQAAALAHGQPHGDDEQLKTHAADQQKQETDQQKQETDQQKQETDQQKQETDQQKQETDHHKEDTPGIHKGDTVHHKEDTVVNDKEETVVNDGAPVEVGAEVAVAVVEGLAVDCASAVTPCVAAVPSNGEDEATKAVTSVACVEAASADQQLEEGTALKLGSGDECPATAADCSLSGGGGSVGSSEAQSEPVGLYPSIGSADAHQVEGHVSEEAPLNDAGSGDSSAKLYAAAAAVQSIESSGSTAMSESSPASLSPISTNDILPGPNGDALPTSNVPDYSSSSSSSSSSSCFIFPPRSCLLELENGMWHALTKEPGNEELFENILTLWLLPIAAKIKPVPVGDCPFDNSDNSG